MTQKHRECIRKYLKRKTEEVTIQFEQLSTKSKMAKIESKLEKHVVYNELIETAPNLKLAQWLTEPEFESSEDWCSKYKPRKAGLVLGNEIIAEELVKWLRSKRIRKNKKKADSDSEDEDIFAICGSSGIGKTALVYAAASEAEFEVFEINTGMKRSSRDLESLVGEMTRCRLVLEKGKIKQALLLIDDADVIFEEDKSMWMGIKNIAKTSKRPIVVTCTDALPDLFLRKCSKPKNYVLCWYLCALLYKQRIYLTKAEASLFIRDNLRSSIRCAELSVPSKHKKTKQDLESAVYSDMIKVQEHYPEFSDLVYQEKTIICPPEDQITHESTIKIKEYLHLSDAEEPKSTYLDDFKPALQQLGLPVRLSMDYFYFIQQVCVFEHNKYSKLPSNRSKRYSLSNLGH